MRNMKKACETRRAFTGSSDRLKDGEVSAIMLWIDSDCRRLLLHDRDVCQRKGFGNRIHGQNLVCTFLHSAAL